MPSRSNPVNRTNVCCCHPDCSAIVKNPTRKYARGHNPNSRSTSAQSNGGKALTLKGKEFLTDRGTKGGLATLTTYGREYFTSIAGRKNRG